VLLISITAGLIFFATVFEDSIGKRQTDIARYLNGADLRVALPLDSDAAQDEIVETKQLSGVTAASPVYQGQVRWGKQMTGAVNWTVISLFAVDIATFDQVSSFPANVSNRTISSVLQDLQTPPTEDVLPAVVSPRALPRNSGIGDLLECQIGQRKYTFEVRGIIEQFPMLEEPFAITTLDGLEQRIDLGAVELASYGRRELWLSTRPEQHATVVMTLQEQAVDPSVAATFKSDLVAGDAQAKLLSFRSDLIAQITTTAFQLNAFILVVLSSASFLLIQAITAHRRQFEFGVLRAMGLSTRQLLALLVLEALTMLTLGLLIGTGVGYGMAYIMRPFLSLTLASSLGGYAIDQIIVNWTTIARLYSVLVGVYVLALVLLLVALMRSDIHRTLRVGDE
jgi:ABC-type lipoprotein release transport system permease subunit